MTRCAEGPRRGGRADGTGAAGRRGVVGWPSGGGVAMPADRFLHARLGHSAKVSSLSDLEYRVWTTYVLAADDFGVMRADAVAFQRRMTPCAPGRPGRSTRGIERLVTVGLVAAFLHQGARYLYQADWQDFQRVRYPGRTMHPLPAAATVSAKTRHLWSVHPGGTKVPALPESSGGTSDVLPNHVRSTSEVLPHNFGKTLEALRLTRAATKRLTAYGLTADREEGGAGGEGPRRGPRAGGARSSEPAEAYDAVIERATS